MAAAAVGRLFYSTTEAGKMLGVSSQHIRDLVDRGDLGCRRVGRKLLIPVNELERLAGVAVPGHEKVTSGLAQQDVIKDLRRVLAEAQRLLAELEG